jgi:hypothetical protein
MKTFKQYLEEENYKKDKRIARLLKHFGKHNPSMIKPGQTPGEAALDHWNNPQFRNSKIGQAIIAASGSKLRRNRILRQRSVGEIDRDEAHFADFDDPTRRRDRRMMQQYDSRVNKLLKKGGYMSATHSQLFGGLRPWEQN